MMDRIGKIFVAQPPLSKCMICDVLMSRAASRAHSTEICFPAPASVPALFVWGLEGGSLRVALYARVSTLNGQHPEMQLSELREYGARRGWQIVGEYVDEGVSGAKESRPQLNRLMSDAHRRKFDLIAVWKIDRFGRSLNIW